MARSIILFGLIHACLWPSVGAAHIGTVVSRIPIPMEQPFGLTPYRGGLLVTDRATGTARPFDLQTRTFGPPIVLPCTHPWGIAADGNALWVYDPQTLKILHFLPDQARVDRVLSDVEGDIRGLAWDGAALWATEGKRFIKMDAEDGTQIKAFEATGPDGEVSGITWDGRYLWIADRRSDRLAVARPDDGTLFGLLPSPGPYPTGMAKIGDALWVLDFEERLLYEMRIAFDLHSYTLGEPHRRRLTFRQALLNFGPSEEVQARLYACLATDGPHQRLLKPIEIIPKEIQRVTDAWGQPFALLQGPIPAGSELTLSYRAEVETRDLQWFILPEWIEPLESIPVEVRRQYLGDGEKLKIHDPVIRELVRKIVADETNPFWIAFKIHRYLHMNMPYVRTGGWNAAPTVLERGNGSCSEFTFAFIALARAAGLPARYEAGVVVRHDDGSIDDVFHRWAEVYLPPFGWIPADPSRGMPATAMAVAASFGSLSHRFFITTHSGGGSPILGWNYNYRSLYEFAGRARVEERTEAKWDPLIP